MSILYFDEIVNGFVQMSQLHANDTPVPSEAEFLRHEVMSLVAILAHDQMLNAEARNRAREELAAALIRLEQIVLPKD